MSCNPGIVVTHYSFTKIFSESDVDEEYCGWLQSVWAFSFNREVYLQSTCLDGKAGEQVCVGVHSIV